jgi:hypothetical protein
MEVSLRTGTDQGEYFGNRNDMNQIAIWVVQFLLDYRFDRSTILACPSSTGSREGLSQAVFPSL